MGWEVIQNAYCTNCGRLGDGYSVVFEIQKDVWCTKCVGLDQRPTTETVKKCISYNISYYESELKYWKCAQEETK